MATHEHWSMNWRRNSHSTRQQREATAGDGKLLAICRDAPLLFPISSTRDVSRWISINRRGRTIKRVRPTRRERGASRQAARLPQRCATSQLHSRRLHLYAVLRKRATVASRFRWPFRAGGGWRRSCSNYSIHEGTHLRLHLHCHLYPSDVAAFAHRGCNGQRDDNRPVGGQTIVYLRVRRVLLILRYISPPLLHRSDQRAKSGRHHRHNLISYPPRFSRVPPGRRNSYPRVRSGVLVN